MGEDVVVRLLAGGVDGEKLHPRPQRHLKQDKENVAEVVAWPEWEGG